MAEQSITHGRAADQAFTTGIRAAALGGLAVLGLLGWFGVISPFAAGFALVVLFPPYMLIVAAVLCKWLGLDKDATDLRPVTRSATDGTDRDLR